MGKTVPLCQHWMPTAARCGSPAMRGKQYCYSHQRQHQPGARKKAERTRQRWFESVPLDDPNAVQWALSEVMQRLLSDQVDPRQAGQILFKLRTATLTRSNAPFRPEGRTQ